MGRRLARFLEILGDALLVPHADGRKGSWKGVSGGAGGAEDLMPDDAAEGGARASGSATEMT
jgi:hypothetical protein